jgi:DNA uptake protein ComE-like DNA-binding protein
MLERVKSYFRHYRSERRGVIVLAVIVFTVYLGIVIFDKYYHPEPTPIEIVFVNNPQTLESSTVNSRFDSRQSLTPFHFNPNTLSDSGYSALGFSEKEIATLRNYMASGATFEIKSDFSKLFFVDDEEYAQLEPYIDLPAERSRRKKETREYWDVDSPRVKWSDTASTEGYAYVEFSCDLNTADTNELKKLRGIGSFYANKIVERREELGGYHNIAQLLELWKMTPEKIDLFADQVYIGHDAIRKIQINTVTAFELSQHPYVSFGEASKIVIRREEEGAYSDSNDLCNAGLLDGNICRKLAPYLIFDQ